MTSAVGVRAYKCTANGLRAMYVPGVATIKHRNLLYANMGVGFRTVAVTLPTCQYLNIHAAHSCQDGSWVRPATTAVPLDVCIARDTLPSRRLVFLGLPADIWQSSERRRRPRCPRLLSGGRRGGGKQVCCPVCRNFFHSSRRRFRRLSLGCHASINAFGYIVWGCLLVVLGPSPFVFSISVTPACVSVTIPLVLEFPIQCLRPVGQELRLLLRSMSIDAYQ